MGAVLASCSEVEHIYKKDATFSRNFLSALLKSTTPVAVQMLTSSLFPLCPRTSEDTTDHVQSVSDGMFSCYKPNSSPLWEALSFVVPAAMCLMLGHFVGGDN